MSEQVQFNENDILNKLLTASENLPEKTIRIPRLGLSFLMRGLKEQQIEDLERRYTEVKMNRGKEERELDRARYSRALINASTIAIGGDSNVKWDHPALLDKYKASAAEQVIKRALLPGEINSLVDVVLELSAYFDEPEEVEEVKNF
ncbi:phage tail assembly chaperone [Chengkuizengella sp. SCS-71B]|uniref:phage tail assembly chaperone n=1 Tax=Chengkuizengella sp. SCS-71B TaxID=3115290 RepID=UPI0032C224D7